MIESSDSETGSLEGKRITEQSTNTNSRRVKLVTKLLVDMNSGLMDDLNYDRDVDKKYDGETNNDRRNSRGNDADISNNDHDNDENGEYGSLIPMAEQQVVPKISKATRLRAERVRIYLDYYYNIMEGTLRSGEDENGHERKNIHRNVEGVYNPLQIIRNRKLKKKYRGETATSGFLFYKAPIIAVIQFSNTPNRKNYKWFVDVNEKYTDLTFRSQHWDELIDPTGHRWFGTQKTHRFRTEAHKIKKRRGSSHITGHLHHHHHKKNNSKGTLLRDSDQSSDSILNKVPKLIVTTDHSDPNLESRTSSNSNGISSQFSDLDKDNYNDKLIQTVSDSEVENGSLKEKESNHLNKFEKILNKTKNPKRWSRSKSPNKIRTEENNNGHETKKDVTKIIPQELAPEQERSNNEGDHRGSVSGPSSKDRYGTYQTPVDGTGVKKLSLLDDIPIHTVKTHSTNKLNIESPEVTKTKSGSYKYDSEINSIEHKRGIKDVEIHNRLTTENADAVINNKNLNIVTNSADNSKNSSSKEATPLSKESSSNNFNELPVDIQLQKYWQDTRYVISTIAIMEHRRQSHDLIRQRAIHRRNLIKVDENTEKNMADTEQIIKEYDEGLDRVLKIGNSWTSKLLNDYSIRVETLISASDRILSDINTTLTLKLKLFQENTDRFGTIRTMQSQKMTKSIYKMLEFFIVLVLWSIWLVVSILREIKFSILLVLRFIKWILW
ncbi:similar to Saccharomyces cerevisiae YBR255W MTC4 Protein of unknown function, required for normal growth rate at 15 degrees C [Maudiozyma barnettii]|mgnify:CR=1 FL=1|uniref:Maintenance of telomere capping protein 4 n=1 Tax=Maudiozyma barnettii TaxID=61262 RepID=A0A8H2VEH6_9SACH|nr:Mtc4p [Kazachstania barnettii]CAB4254056.1 similar to Saccharomyces cerevisiae YBR255W MTC4 Protein of unknown function, required for normal growth rate at 15 degrees C [Kazachstania barnettii]CAD1781806.1 similar to Saccharomyces cerevisiae YBR255W MTC4 Protein of unknown function, required for normal growth rate at 15 degrees C [Kazachstania barnettii]